jgi:hypothetical protein
LKQVKTALRLTTTAFDSDELTPLINACLLDLELAGVKNLDINDDAIKRAIVLYCKANFGNIEDAERFNKNYHEFKKNLASSLMYTVEV